MYTNILHEKGLESVTERFKYSYLDENVLELLELCLNSYDFECDGKWFLQNTGTTMGTQCSLPPVTENSTREKVFFCY